MTTRFIKMMQIIFFIIITVILSIIVLNYFNIDMNSNDTLKLNRYAIYEGLDNNNNNNNEKKKNPNSQIIF